MNTVMDPTQSRTRPGYLEAVRLLSVLILTAGLLTGCGQPASEHSSEGVQAATETERTTGFVSDAAVKAAQQAVQSTEQRALRETVRVSEETGSSP